MNWQPIETAPKDGTDILLWDGYECVTARWKERSLTRTHGLWQLVQTGDHAESDGVDTPPTHWMPLPEPPPSQNLSVFGVAAKHDFTTRFFDA